MGNCAEPLKLITSRIFLVDLNLRKSWHIMKLLNGYLILYCYQCILNMDVNNESIFFLLRNIGSIIVLLVLLLDYPLTCFLPYTIYQTLKKVKSVEAITKYLTKFMVPKHQKSFCHETPLPKNDCMVYLLICWNNTQITLEFSLSVTTLTSHA